MDGKEKQLRTRFTPTPSGYLHQGNLFSFILTWLIARKSKGAILLRIDDIDQSRVREQYIADIFKALNWLGLDYDEGPSGVEDFLKNFSQLTRLERYQQALSKDRLSKKSFYCKCSRKAILTLSKDGGYPGTCMSANVVSNDSALRIITDEQSLVIKNLIDKDSSRPLPSNMRHFVIRKKDGFPSYQLTSVIDDDFYQINTIVRGADLLDSSYAQLYLSRLIGLGHFDQTKFLHHPLIKNNDIKLSKSQGNMFVPSKTADSRERLFIDFSKWIGFQEKASTLDDLLALFEVDHLKQLRQTRQ